MASIDLAMIPGDGVGPKVMVEGLKILDAVCEILGGPGIAAHMYDLGARRYLVTGETFTDADLEDIKGRDAIFSGAIGDPRTPSGVLECGLLLKLRFVPDRYVNLRPSRHYLGAPTPLINPGGIDFLVACKGIEGFCCGSGSVVWQGTPHEITTEMPVNTACGVERVVRYVFARAQARSRKRLTYVHKHNVLINTGGLWRRVVEEVGVECPDVVVDYTHVDAATILLVTDPTRLDVITTDNLLGDILTDEAGAITGGIGLAASGNVNPEKAFPSMFEPIHGSAPDIADKQIADLMATIALVVLMFDHLGLAEHARAIENAIESDMTARTSVAEAGTPSKRSTSDVGSAAATSVRG